MKTAGGIASCWLMLLNVTAPPALTGEGEAVAVIVTGIKLACVGIKLFTQALSNVAAPAGPTSVRNPRIAAATTTTALACFTSGTTPSPCRFRHPTTEQPPPDRQPYLRLSTLAIARP